jgi:choline-sulfatase
MSLLLRLLCVLCLAVNAFAGVAARPNVVLITIDTTRSDRMGFLGSRRGLTPNLDALARQSIVFTRAYAQVPLTTPSHATILTGTYPQFHQVTNFGVELSQDLPYAPAIFRAQGYRTAAFVGSIVLDPEAQLAPGFERGFDTYNAGFHQLNPGEDRYQTTERRAQEVVARALAWLNKKPVGPFFLWVHLYDAHDPYDPPEPYKSRYAAAPYDGEIAYQDFVLGRLFSQLRARGLYRNSLIAVMSDHGEALGEHGEETHGIFLYDETFRVPLLIKMPGAPSAEKRIDSPVRLVDVLPTILQATGIPIPAAVQGESLLGMMKPAPAGAETVQSPERPSYAEVDYAHQAFGWSSLQALRTVKYLFIQAPRRELYDQQADPQERHDLSSVSKAVADTIAGQLDSFRQKTSNSREASKASLNREQEEKLGALGYVAARNTSSNSTADSGADPKDKIELANLMHQSRLLEEQMRYQDAIPLLEQIVAQEPKLAVSYRQLGQCYMALRDFKNAVVALRKTIELDPGATLSRSQLGVALFAIGDYEAAIPQFQVVVQEREQENRLPEAAGARFSLATANERAGHTPEAIKEYKKVIELVPGNFLAYLFLGRLLFEKGDASAAVPNLEKAVLLHPDAPRPHLFLAEAYERLDRQADAKRERAKAERLGESGPK